VNDRAEGLIEACITGTHVHQMLMFAESGEGDADCFSQAGLDVETLKGLDEECQQLLALPTEGLERWTSEGGGDVEEHVRRLSRAGIDLSARLPVSVVTAYLKEEAPTAEGEAIRALASLYQLCLEVKRDGDELQALFRLHLALGLPVCPDDVGLVYTEGDLDRMAEALASDSCSAPYRTNAAGWRVALQKIKHWGEKYSGRVTAETYGDELLSASLKGLIPQIKSVPPTKVCVLGHSFSSQVHWSSHGTFPCIAEAVFLRENPGVTFSFVTEGGLHASRAYEVYLQEALSSKPDVVLLVIAVEGEEDHEALGRLIRGICTAGARAVLFDRLRALQPEPADAVRIAREAGGEVIVVGTLLDEHPEQDLFLSLDGVHMGPAYHKFMAVELVKHLVVVAPGATGADR